MLKKRNLLIWWMKKKLSQTISIPMSSGFFVSPETGIYFHTDLHPLGESSHPSWAPGAACRPSPRWSKTSSAARTWAGDAPPEHGRVTAEQTGLSQSLPLSAVPVPATLRGEGEGGTGQARARSVLDLARRSASPFPASLNLFPSFSASCTGP